MQLSDPSFVHVEESGNLAGVAPSLYQNIKCMHSDVLASLYLIISITLSEY